MDDFEEAIRAGKFQEVLLATTGAKDSLSLLYRAIGLIGTNRPKEAMELLLEQRRGMFESKPILTLKTNFELRFELGEFDEAYEDLKEFNEYPYVSQKVEEHLRVLPEAIRAAERRAHFASFKTDEEIEKVLSDPKDDYELLSILSSLSKRGIAGYEGEIRALCSSDHAQDVRAYALMLLMKARDPNEVYFKKGNETIRLLPAKVEEPFSSPFYEEVKKRLSSEKDVSIAEGARNLLDQWSLTRFPLPLGKGGEEALTAEALLSLSRRYFQLVEESSEEAKDLADRIHKELSENPPLTY